MHRNSMASTTRGSKRPLFGMDHCPPLPGLLLGSIPRLIVPLYPSFPCAIPGHLTASTSSIGRRPRGLLPKCAACLLDKRLFKAQVKLAVGLSRGLVPSSCRQDVVVCKQRPSASSTQHTPKSCCHALVCVCVCGSTPTRTGKTQRGRDVGRMRRFENKQARESPVLAGVQQYIRPVYVSLPLHPLNPPIPHTITAPGHHHGELQFGWCQETP